MLAPAIVLVSTLAACRINFDELASDRGDGGDASDLGPFAPPTHQTMLGEIRDDKHPTLTADLLEIYFGTTRTCSNCYEVYFATRASTASAWTTPAPVAPLTSPAATFAPEVSPDGLTLWFASERQNPAGGADIWMTTRSSRTQPWGTPTRETSLSTAGYDSAPSLSGDGLTMTLTSDGAGGQAADIFVASRASTTSPWSPPVALAELNTADHDSAGPIRDGGLRIFFDRETTSNQYDIYVAERATTSAPFGPATLVDNINTTTTRDIDAWLSADMRTIFFASDRTGNMEIYESTR
jgi:Tol biopolymer transport system component